MYVWSVICESKGRIFWNFRGTTKIKRELETDTMILCRRTLAVLRYLSRKVPEAVFLQHDTSK